MRHTKGRCAGAYAVAVPTNAPRHHGDEAPPGARRTVEPLDPPMVPFAVGGIVVWAVVGLVLLAMRPTLIEQGREDWLRICLAGFLLGFPGLLLMIRHDANRRRRRESASGTAQRR